MKRNKRTTNLGRLLQMLAFSAAAFAGMASLAYAGGGATTAYNFLRLEPNARSAALGGSFVSVIDDPNIIFFNPGGISTLTNRQISFGFCKHLLDINAGYASYGQQLEDIGWIGAAVAYMNYGSFTKADELGNQLGTFSAGDLALVAGYSNLLYETVNYGVNLKLIYSSIDGNASTAIALDGGLIYIIPEQQISIGASILNVGTALKSYIDTKEDLPLDIKIGISKRLEHLPLYVNFNFHKLNESTDNFFDRFSAFSIGGEFTVSEAVRLRIGYNNERRRELKIGTSAGLAGFSVGGGLLFAPYKIDYSFSSFGDIGALHRITVGASF
jgi:hypothetical protein